MKDGGLIHDAAHAMAAALLEIVGPVLRDDEKHDVFEEFVEICKAGIEAYTVQRNREMQRFNPTRN